VGAEELGAGAALAGGGAPGKAGIPDGAGAAHQYFTPTCDQPPKVKTVRRAWP
jgi:hypothetical protein